MCFGFLVVFRFTTDFLSTIRDCGGVEMCILYSVFCIVCVCVYVVWAVRVGATARMRVVNFVKLWKTGSVFGFAVVVDDDDACTFHFINTKNKRLAKSDIENKNNHRAFVSSCDCQRSQRCSKTKMKLFCGFGFTVIFRSGWRMALWFHCVWSNHLWFCNRFWCTSYCLMNFLIE